MSKSESKKVRRIRNSRLRAFWTLGIGAFLSLSCAVAIFWFNSPQLFRAPVPIIISVLDDKCQFNVHPFSISSYSDSFFKSADLILHLGLSCNPTEFIISKAARFEFGDDQITLGDGLNESCGKLEELRIDSSLFRHFQYTENPQHGPCGITVLLRGAAKRVGGAIYERSIYVSTNDVKQGRETSDNSITDHIYTESFWVHKGWNSDAASIGKEAEADLRRDNAKIYAGIDEIEPSWVLVRHHSKFNHLNVLNIFLSLLAGLGIGTVFESVLTLTIVRLFEANDD